MTSNVPVDYQAKGLRNFGHSIEVRIVFTLNYYFDHLKLCGQFSYSIILLYRFNKKLKIISIETGKAKHVND